WTLQPISTTGSAPRLSGTLSNVHAITSGGHILRFDGSAWSSVFTDANNPPYAMHVPAAEEGYYATCWGWGQWDGSSWQFHGTQFDFCDIYDTWWMRDSSSNLQWYAVGNENFANGIRVWKFDPASGSFG